MTENTKLTLDQAADRVADVLGVDPELIGIRYSKLDRSTGEVSLTLAQVEALLALIPTE